jgi:hypothetical protein
MQTHVIGVGMIETKYLTPLGVVLIDPIGADRKLILLILTLISFYIPKHYCYFSAPVLPLEQSEKFVL